MQSCAFCTTHLDRRQRALHAIQVLQGEVRVSALARPCAYGPDLVPHAHLVLGALRELEEHPADRGRRRALAGCGEMVHLREHLLLTQARAGIFRRVGPD